MKKLTVIFTGTHQVGHETFSDYHKSASIELTEEQQKLLKPPEGMFLRELFLEDA